MLQRGHGLPCLAVLLLLLLSACATPTQTGQLLSAAPDIPPLSELTQVPFYPQREYQCGPAALATVINHYGTVTTPDELVPLIFIPELKGSLQVEMLAAASRLDRLAIELDGRLESVLREVAKGVPVLVMQNLGLQAYPFWHYAVVVGYDLDRREIILRSGEVQRLVRPLAVFERTWQRAGHWALAVVPPGVVPVSVSEQEYIDAALTLERVGSAESRVRVFRSGSRRWPASFVLQMGLGNAYFMLRQYRLAEQAFRMATGLKPERAEAWNNLAYALLYQGRQPQAEDAVKQALRLEPQNAEYQNSLRDILPRTPSR